MKAPTPIGLWITATALIRFCWARPAFTSRFFPAMTVRGGSVAPFEQKTAPASWNIESTWDQVDADLSVSEDSNLLVVVADDSRTAQRSGTVSERSSFQTPSIHISKMAQAIRWTSLMNRKLHAAAEGSRLLVDPNYAFQQVPQFHASNVEPLRGGGGDCTTAVYRIPLVGVDDSSASIFHAASSWRSNKTHFKQYLARVVEILAPKGANEQQPTASEAELSLAMIYLDRATSLETPRAAGVPPCPFATPRTAPRLALTAMLLAVSSVRCIEDMSHLYAEIETAFGIPTSDCHKMVGWMRAALGDVGIFVTSADMQEWKHLWER